MRSEGSSRRQYSEELDSGHWSHIPAKPLHCNLQNLRCHILIVQVGKMPAQGLHERFKPGNRGPRSKSVIGDIHNRYGIYSCYSQTFRLEQYAYIQVSCWLQLRPSGVGSSNPASSWNYVRNHATVVAEGCKKRRRRASQLREIPRCPMPALTDLSDRNSGASSDTPVKDDKNIL